jgi:hypothetical protein
LGCSSAPREEGVKSALQRSPAIASSWLAIDNLSGSNNLKASATEPVGVLGGQVASLPGDANSFVYSFGGAMKGGLFGDATSEGFVLHPDATWDTDAVHPYLDIPPLKGGRSLYGLAPLWDPSSKAYTGFLALGGITANDSHAPVLTDAWKFTPGVGWTQVTANLPIPTDTSVEPLQPSGAQAWTVSPPTYDHDHIVFAGGLPANPASPPAMPPNVPGLKASACQVFTNNAIDYDIASGTFFDTSMVPDTVIADPTVTPNITFQAGVDGQCTALSDGRRVCCGGRQVRCSHTAFSLGNRCQIYTPSNRTWTACQPFPGVPGEDYDNPICCQTPGCSPIPQCMDPNDGRSEVGLAVTSNDHVLIFGGFYRQEYLPGGPTVGYDNQHEYPSQAIVDFNPANCTRGTAYAVHPSAMLYSRAQEQVVAIAADTFLVIAGFGQISTGGFGELYQTERVTYAKGPATVTTQCEADLPTWADASGALHPIGFSLDNAAGLLANGSVFYAGAGAMQSNKSTDGSANMMALWQPGLSTCAPPR